MRTAFFTLIFLFSLSIFAQYEYNHLSWLYTYEYKKLLADHIPTPKGADIDMTVTTVKDGKVKKHKSVYDDFGNLVLEGHYNKNGVLIVGQQNKFDEEGKVLENKKFRKGKLIRHVVFERNDEGKLVQLEHYKKNEKLANMGKWSYNNSDCMGSSTWYKKDKVTVYRQWDYEYYEECDKKKSTLSNGAGKILKEWTYDCKQEGEVLQKKKDVTQVCKWEETDGDYLLKVTQSFDEKGRTYKLVYKYRSSDTSIVNYKRYNHQEELTYESSYNYDFRYPTRSISYKKGVPVYVSEYQYEGEKLVARSFYKNEKMISKATYTYNEEDQLTAFNTFKKGNVLVRSAELKYN